jgi:hypothetical protein
MGIRWIRNTGLNVSPVVCTAVVGPGVPVLPLLQVFGAADQAHALQGGQGQSQAGYSVFFLPVFFYSVLDP